LSRTLHAWRQILAIHLISVGLGIIVFAPLLGALGQVLLKLSGEPALADMDILFFALSPIGMLAFLLFATVAIVISAFELTSMMAIGIGVASGKPVDVFAALTFSLGRAGQIFHFAARLVFKLLLIVAPFLLAGAVIAYLLISDYDINYYLSVQPPVFWAAASVIGILLVAMAVLLVRRLVRWSLALPLVLFAGALPAQSFAASEKLTQKSAALVFWALVVWGAATLLLGVVVTVAVQFLAASLVPLFIDSVTFLAILFGLLAALWSIASVAAAALAAGGFAMLLTMLAHELEPRFQAIDLQPELQRTV
jgi:glycerophosphoryl diester phosphodiesterase